MKYDCKHIDELMMDYLYRELDDAQMTAYRQHLAGCPACAAQLGGFERTRAAVQAIPAVDPPPGISAKLLRAAAEHRPQKGAWARFVAWLSPLTAHPGVAAVATFVIIAGVAGFLVARNGVPERATQKELGATTTLERPAAQAAAPTGNADVPAPAAPVAAAPADPAAGADLADNEEAQQQKDKPSEPAADALRYEDKGVVRMRDGDKAPARPPVASKNAAPATEAKPMAKPEPAKPSLAAPLDRRAAAGGLPEVDAEGSIADQDGVAQPASPSPAPPPAAAGPSRAAGDAVTGRALDSKDDATRATEKKAERPDDESAGKTRPEDVRALHGQARAKAAGGDCAGAMALRDRVYRIDPSYFERNVKNDTALTSCFQRQKAKKSGGKQAPPQPAEAAPVPADRPSK